MSGCVKQNVIDIDQDVIDVPEYRLHQLLKTGWTAQKAHWRGDPVVLAFTRNRECSEWL